MTGRVAVSRPNDQTASTEVDAHQDDFPVVVIDLVESHKPPNSRRGFASSPSSSGSSMTYADRKRDEARFSALARPRRRRTGPERPHLTDRPDGRPDHGRRRTVGRGHGRPGCRAREDDRVRHRAEGPHHCAGLTRDRPARDPLEMPAFRRLADPAGVPPPVVNGPARSVSDQPRRLSRAEAGLKIGAEFDDARIGHPRGCTGSCKGKGGQTRHGNRHAFPQEGR